MYVFQLFYRVNINFPQLSVEKGINKVDFLQRVVFFVVGSSRLFCKIFFKKVDMIQLFFEYIL
jgi:hypothetical protein